MPSKLCRMARFKYNQIWLEQMTNQYNFNQKSNQNFDQAELDNFNQFADKWWDENGEFGALHKMNPLRLEFILRQPDLVAGNGLQGKKALDIGCGGGILSEALAKLGAEVSAIDLAEDVLTAAKIHAENAGLVIDYQAISAEEFAAANAEKFDLVTCMEMLEHVPDPAAIIQAAALATRPGGYVFVSTLNRTKKAYLLGILAAENLLNLVPKGTHQHEKFIKPSELAEIARQAGLRLLDQSGIDFNPLLKHYALSNNLDINYLMAFEKI